MIVPVNKAHKINVKDMKVISLMAEGLTQTAAAERVGIPQTYVSRIIKKVEFAYGFRIGDGARKGWALNDKGVQLGRQMSAAVAIINGDESHPFVSASERLKTIGEDVRKKAFEIIEAATY